MSSAWLAVLVLATAWIVARLVPFVAPGDPADMDTTTRLAEHREGIVDQRGGVTHAVAFQRTGGLDVAWLGVGPRLVAVDLCDAAAPRVLGRAPTWTGVIHDIALDPQRGLAFVAAGGAGLGILDIHPPWRAPSRVGWIPLPGLLEGWTSEAHRLVLAPSGQRLWIGGPAGLFLVDVRDPDRPSLVRHMKAPEGGFGDLVRDLAVAGDRLLVAWNAEGLRVLDAEEGTEQLEYAPRGTVALTVAAAPEGHVVFLGDGELLRVVDLARDASDDANRELGRLHLGTGVQARAAIVRGQRLWLATRDASGRPGGLRVIDVSRPSEPRFVESRPPDDAPFASGLGGSADVPVGLAAAAEHMLLAEDGVGLRLVTLTEGQEPSIAGALDVAPPARAVAAAHDGAWIAGPGSALFRVGLGHPDSPPPPVGRVALPAVPSAVARWSGGRAVTAGGALAVVGPAAVGPALVATIGPLDSARDVAVTTVDGRPLAVVADGRRGLVVVDLADWSRPEVLGELALVSPGGAATTAEAVAADGDHVGVVDGATLFSISIAEPTAPRLLDALDVQGGARDVALGGSLVAIAPTFGGLVLVDRSSPASLTEVGRLPIVFGSNVDARAVALDVAHDRAWIAAGTTGLLPADIADPSAPSIVGRFHGAGMAVDVALSDGLALAAMDDGGLLVVGDTSATPVPLPTPSPPVACRAERLWLPALPASADDGR